jgi:hypothetical protein
MLEVNRLKPDATKASHVKKNCRSLGLAFSAKTNVFACGGLGRLRNVPQVSRRNLSRDLSYKGRRQV